MTGALERPMVPVLVAALFDPVTCRVRFDMPHGATLAEIVRRALPGLSEAELEMLRITLVTPSGMQMIERRFWPIVRPNAGVHVVLRVIPADDGGRSILGILVSVAAIALGGVYGAALGSALGISAELAGGLITLGVNVVGSLLINSLVPPSEPEQAENRYAISGWRNRLNPDGAVPVVLGTMRYDPPYAATNYTDIVGDLQHVVSLFAFGIGEVEITDIRIGDTPISEYEDVETELRLGLPDDSPVTLYPRQIVEEGINAELTRPKARDDLGEIIDDADSIETPVTRTTGRDASAVGIVLAFPAGLYRMDGDSEAQIPQIRRVKIKIEYAEIGSDDWTLVREMLIGAKKLETIYRLERFAFPSRGRWQIRLTRMTSENTSTQVQDRTVWAALQTLRPEYPLNTDLPLALLAVRMRATYQLNGQLDNLNAIVKRVCLDWDHETETWIRRATSNPASLYRYILQSPGNPRPVADAGIDLDLLVDWHDYCRLKGLRYDGVLDDGSTTLRQALAQVASAGRASPRHDGMLWGVVIDRPQELPVDEISPRNSWGFSIERNYVTRPHALRVKFRNAENDYEPDERLVRWPGYEGEIDLTEVMEAPGKVYPDEIYRELLRRAYEIIHRPDTYQLNQLGPVRVATRGDLVRVSHGVLDAIQKAARVVAVEGTLIELDDIITMSGDRSYGVRYRVFSDASDPADTIGTPLVRQVVYQEGEQTLLRLTGAGPMPAVGSLVFFGLAGSESAPMRVLSVENGKDDSVLLRLIDEATIIDELTDAAVIPPWTGRIGEALDDDLTAPAVPRIVSVSSGYKISMLEPEIVHFIVAPGSGAIPVERFEVEHRETGTSGWSVIDVPVADGGGTIEVYSYATGLDLRVRALSRALIPSAFSEIVTFAIGEQDEDAPDSGDLASVDVVAGLGHVTLTVAIALDARTKQLQVYRVPTGEPLDRDLHAVGEVFPVTPGRTFVLRDGDTTMVNLISNGSLDDGTGWAATGWTFSDGVANLAAGVNGYLSQTPSLVEGATYRFAYTQVNAGGLGSTVFRIVGSTTAGSASAPDSGLHFGTLTAPAAPASAGIFGGLPFEGTVDDVVLYRESAACPPAGTYDYYVEPKVSVAPPGPMSGPFTVTIV
ncbi:hypothetical protein [Puniceibacterium sp. IMCC21224]|uniref:TipJ family phage tail tip protein n=1 Tax=Puniceibacterium sp. IMCC21224 TaxID=1618204 RepID=UPI00065D8309|nr:hypothetical protein [Puniceibacterium sp. IMCC21224]KMK68589.1 hypothetical protein IMCC21224_113472 [Puniceibacterium sp. IMCC21224]